MADETEDLHARLRYVIPADGDCAHRPGRVTYLGQMGLTAFYRCEQCEAVLIASPRESAP